MGSFEWPAKFRLYILDIRSNDWISNRELVSKLIRKVTLGTVWKMDLRVGVEKQVRAKKSLQIFLDIPIQPL